MLVRNSRTNWITRLQEWDYFHGIASIKRVQGFFQGTLVAQGAFSLCRREVLLRAGGHLRRFGDDNARVSGLFKGRRHMPVGQGALPRA